MLSSTRNTDRSRSVEARCTASLRPWPRRPPTTSAATPTTTMPRVASRNGAPTTAPIATCPDSSPERIATTGIVDSGSAVATAARMLPTAPCPRLSRVPAHSTALVNTTAPARIMTKLSASHPIVAAMGVLPVGVLTTGAHRGHPRKRSLCVDSQR